MTSVKPPMTYLRGRIKSRKPARRSRPLPWLASLAFVLAAVFGGGWLALTLFSNWASNQIAAHHVTGKDAVSIELDAVRTALTVAAGLGAGITLLLALRRQSTTERAQQFTEHDAQEQRITDLYVAAANQLGSEKAAVRLAGLYALQRLGQNNSHLRQTVFDVICAYLRMPYTPPLEILKTSQSESLVIEDEHRQDQAERRQELQVRLTAQRLLADHSRLPQPPPEPRDEPETYWRTPNGELMTIDLTQAVLVNLDLSACKLRQLRAARANFHGSTDINEAAFESNVNLSEAEFHNYADLSRAEFQQFADISGAQFHGDADLSMMQFQSDADISGAQFHGEAYLSETKFQFNANLSDVRFYGDAFLFGAQIHGYAHLLRTDFRGQADLHETEFHTRADLSDSQLHGDADLAGAAFHPDSVLPRGWRLELQPESNGLHTAVRDQVQDSTSETSSTPEPDHA